MLSSTNNALCSNEVDLTMKKNQSRCSIQSSLDTTAAAATTMTTVVTSDKLFGNHTAAASTAIRSILKSSSLSCASSVETTPTIDSLSSTVVSTQMNDTTTVLLSTTLTEAIAHIDHQNSNSYCENVRDNSNSDNNKPNDGLIISKNPGSNLLHTLDQIAIAASISAPKQKDSSSPSNRQSSSPTSKSYVKKGKSDADDDDSVEFTIDQMCANQDNETSSNFGSSRGLDYLPLFQQHQLEEVSKKKALLFPSDEEKERRRSLHGGERKMPEVIDISLYSEHDRIGEDNNDSFDELMEDFVSKAKAARDRKRSKKQQLLDVDAIIDASANDINNESFNKAKNDSTTKTVLHSSQSNIQSISKASMSSRTSASERRESATKQQLLTKVSSHSRVSTTNKGAKIAENKDSVRSLNESTAVNITTEKLKDTSDHKKTQKKGRGGVLKNNNDKGPVFQDVVDVEMGGVNNETTVTKVAISSTTTSAVVPVNPPTTATTMSSMEVESNVGNNSKQRQRNITPESQDARLKRIPRETAIVVVVCLIVLILLLSLF
jgi:hypothetical protein